MRILHVLFSSRIAGSERYCLDLANRQAAAGHDVHVAGLRSSPLRAALSPQVRFHPFGRFFRGLLVRRLADRLAPDVCHGHLSAACKALGGAADRHLTLATLHVGFKPHQHGRLDGLICVNRAQSARLAGYRGQARVIPNWLPLVPAPAATPGLREELNLGDDVFLVGAVGRLHASKGMDVLISAFRASAPARAALVILGEGPQRAELEQLRAGDPRIHLLGYRPAVHPCLRDLDLFVSPSREESFGLAIVEAMSAGLPIIATAAEGPAEFLRDQPAVLVPPGSHEALTAAIRTAHARFETDGLPKVGYDLSLFDPSARLANITDFYAHVLDAKQRSRAAASRPVAVAT
jgi:glycosyltransferase involved in cell wall biosynthesis